MVRHKFITAALAALLIAVPVCGCGQGPSGGTESSTVSSHTETDNSSADSDSAISIVTTIFPEYDWVQEIVKDSPAGIETTLLLDDGVDLHSYQPTAEDIMKIADCDIFVYVGGESDAWVEDALKEATNKDMTVVKLLDILGDSAREEVLVEGMEEEEHDDTDEEESPEYDEHVWLSLRNAAILTDAIEKAVEEKDPAHASTYAENLAAYKELLSALDEQFKAAVSDGSTKTLVFGDRFPFLYMASDYGLEYYAAFAGCSAETEASFETIIFLTGKVDELHLSSICTIESSNQEIAKTIRNNTKTRDQEILTFDSMQSTTARDMAEGTTYLTLMEKNLEVLKKALA